MATIEERAKECVHQHYSCNGEYPCTKRAYCVMGTGKNTAYDCCECGADEFYEGYIACATEQQEIDDAERDTAVYNLLLLKLDAEKKLWTEKACEWLCEHIDDYARIGEDGAWVEHSVVRDFKKAMEE